MRLTIVVAVQSNGLAGGVMLNLQASRLCPFLLLRTYVRKETPSVEGEKSRSKCQSTELDMYRQGLIVYL